MKKQIFISIVIAISLIGSLQLSGCGAKKSDKEESLIKESSTEVNKYDNDGTKEKASVSSEPNNDADKQVTQSGKDAEIKTAAKTTVQKVPSKIIKTADVSMQVKDIKDSRKAILAIAKKSEAYIATENQVTNFNSITNDMTIRIKPEGFDDILDKLIEQSIYTDSKKITSQDVTADYIDTETRLKSKKEVEIRYTEILKKAGTINDILAVEEKLRQIREEIEAAEGKLKYLNDQVGYSTINLHFYEKLDSQPTPDSGFFYKLGKAFKSGWHGLLIFFIAIIYLWPLWIIAAAIFYFVLWLIKRSKRRKLQK